MICLHGLESRHAVAVRPLDRAPRRAGIATMLVLLLVGSSCLRVHEPGGTGGAPEPPDTGEGMRGTIQFLNLEGGCWTIRTVDGATLEPINLPEEFRKDGLEVRVVTRARNDLASICQVGAIVEIVRIEPVGDTR